MAPVPPSVRRQRVGAELKRLREAAGLSVHDAAQLVPFSASKISRMESDSRRGLQGDDVNALCKAYGVSAEDAARLVDLTREVRTGAWWHEYGSDVVGFSADFIELELDAEEVREWESDIVPGQLQTRDYAAAVIRHGRPDLGEDVIRQRVDLRMERQRQRAASTKALWVIIDEAVLLRPVGGRDIMADQLVHLAQMARSPRVTVQVIPLAIGGHASLGIPFTLLSIRDGVEYVYRDSITGGTYTDDVGEVSVYRETWSRLSATAADFDRSLDMINRAEANHRSAVDANDDTP
jgi:transcriptional regulator with XRE-family HTH domain